LSATPQNPTAFLWEELRALLPPDDYAALRARYDAQSRRYGLAAKLRQARRELTFYERMAGTVSPTRRPGYEQKIANRQATIQRLEAEIDSAT